MFFIVGVKCPRFHTQFLDCFECGNSTQNFFLNICVNALCALKIFSREVSDLGHTYHFCTKDKCTYCLLLSQDVPYFFHESYVSGQSVGWKHSDKNLSTCGGDGVQGHGWIRVPWAKGEPVIPTPMSRELTSLQLGPSHANFCPPAESSAG